ncbi:tyrosyl-DNA phosphodiesterase 2 [Nephila pilipes]|uniref:Tyrosyl-DNA phosphodiesterase 2 n=1 Tax=Nephila pilipes TaxID=299642 RepID=A0A8X6ND23_NEPPI|nr:tyrosyl-DNA phosphodiesterase 2 [Nephila pilipes]
MNLNENKIRNIFYDSFGENINTVKIDVEKEEKLRSYNIEAPFPQSTGMSSDDSDNSEDIPEVSECQRLCECFAEITGTDEACAQFYLQDRKWDLDRSVNDFFEDRNNKGAVRVNDKKEAEVVVVVDGSCEGLAAAATAMLAESALCRGAKSSQKRKFSETCKTPSSSEKKESSPVLRFITWNIDGLDEKNLMLRTKAVCKTILNEQADIVFVQEVVPTSAEYFLKNLTDYHCLFGNEVGYFIGTFLKKSTVSYTDFKIIDFNTRMMRNALKINAVYQNRNLILINSHLESTVEGCDERKEQLQLMFKEVLATPDDTTTIFAGDLNLREKELNKLGGLPAGIEDLWIACGQRKECAYTFDMTRNDNLIINGKFKPRYVFQVIIGESCVIMKWSRMEDG